MANTDTDTDTNTNTNTKINNLVNSSSDANQTIIATVDKCILLTGQSEAQINENLGILKTNFDTEISNVKNLNSYYSTLKYGKTDTLDTIKEIYSDQQDELDEQNKNFTEDILTNNRKTFYEREAIITLEKWHTFFWYIYYICFVLFLLGILFASNSIPRYISLIIAVFILFYPYIIAHIINKVKEYFDLLYRIFPKNVYNNL